MENQWFVFYTKSRHEKKVEDLLQRAGYEVFLPLQTVLKQWSDRKMKVTVPLFNSYIFVKIRPSAIEQVLKTPGIAWSVRLNGKPAILRQDEFEVVQRFIQSGYFFEAASITEELASGDKTVITDGPLRGLEGLIIERTGDNSFFVALSGIQQVIRAEIPAFLLKKA